MEDGSFHMAATSRNLQNPETALFNLRLQLMQKMAAEISFCVRKLRIRLMFPAQLALTNWNRLTNLAPELT